MIKQSNKPANAAFRLPLLSILLFTFFLNTHAFAQPDGAKLFKQNCAACHRLDSKKLTGPGLEGVMSRVPSEEWMIKWIKNPAEVIASGDAYAKKIYEENNKAQMTAFSFLKDDEIAAIIAHVKTPPAAEPTATAAPAAGADGSAAPETKGIDPFFLLLGLIVFLAILIIVLRSTRHSLQNLLNSKDGKAEEADRGVWGDARHWIINHKRTMLVFILIFTGWALQKGWYTLADIGIYTGYKPEQPIQFSHKIHAGDNAINCVYCHNSVEKSKTAGIPSVNVCMNCHKAIDQGPTTGKTEIAKIYEAAGFNPETQQYDKPQKPIKWIKVHNLQDFVYFNHSQHVVVGKQDCANCHGDVKTMTVAEQASPLTMAWCLDCHRKTEVPGMKDNPYYADLHAKLAEKYKGQPITVAKMGGIECGKCHY